jgi:methyl-accepting chemotaxis protein
MKSIKTKLILVFSALVLVISLAVGVISITSAVSAITNEAESALVSLSKEGAATAASRYETQTQTLKLITLNYEVQSMNWESQKRALEEFLSETNYTDLGIVKPNGDASFLSGTTINIGQEEYFTKAFNGECTSSDLIINGDELSLLYTSPIKKKDEIVGVLIGRRDGSVLTDITDDIGFGASGYSYIINKEGTIIAHPDSQKVVNQFNPIALEETDPSLKSVATVFKKVLELKQGFSKYFFEEKDRYVGFAPIEGTTWTLVVAANADDVLSAIPKIEKKLLTTIIIQLLISLPLVYIIGVTIVKPIEKVKKYAEKISNYDLTSNISPKLLTKRDETGILAQSMQNIVDNLRNMISNIVDSAEQVTAASEELTATTGQSANASQEIAKTVEEVSRGASDQAVQTEHGSSNVIVLGNIIEKDMDYMNNLGKASEEVTEIVGIGLLEIEKLTKITEESNVASKEIYDVIQKTNQSSNKIGEASSVIASIADQTNLLALNAAIEAARAGEAGKGFAVVADEIRKLAEQSSASTMAIDEIVKELQHNAQAAVTTMERVSAIALEQTASVAENEAKYIIINEAMKETKKAFEQLNSSVTEKDIKKNEILQIMQALSAIAEENSAATQEVTSTIEEQTASIEEIANASESLSGLAQYMQSIIQKFKI